METDDPESTRNFKDLPATKTSRKMPARTGPTTERTFRKKFQHHRTSPGSRLHERQRWNDAVACYRLSGSALGDHSENSADLVLDKRMTMSGAGGNHNENSAVTHYSRRGSAQGKQTGGYGVTAQLTERHAVSLSHGATVDGGLLAGEVTDEETSAAALNPWNAERLVKLPAERAREQARELGERPAPVVVPEARRAKRRAMNLLEADVHEGVATRCLLRAGRGGSRQGRRKNTKQQALVKRRRILV